MSLIDLSIVSSEDYDCVGKHFIHNFLFLYRHAKKYIRAYLYMEFLKLMEWLSGIKVSSADSIPTITSVHFMNICYVV